MIDARGLSCPQPVIMVQKAVNETNATVLEVLVDNVCAVENITRFANGQGYSLDVQEKSEEEFLLKLEK